jgi:hybrid cluster-associated redox disulfide protein
MSSFNMPTNMKRTAKITENMKIEEVIKNFPAAAPVFLKYGLHCLGCPMATPETIKEAAELHRIEIKKFIRELNKATKQNDNK